MAHNSVETIEQKPTSAAYAKITWPFESQKTPPTATFFILELTEPSQFNLK